MTWQTNACYRITYADYSSVTFRIEGEIPLAIHKIRIRDLHTGRERYLFDLLMHNWIDCELIDCATAHKGIGS